MNNPYDQDETCDGCGKDASVCTCNDTPVHISGGTVDELGREIDLADESIGYLSGEKFYSTTPEGRFLAEQNISDWDRLLIASASYCFPQR